MPGKLIRVMSCGAFLALIVGVLGPASSADAGSTSSTAAKFEPADGKIYSGAGQSPEAIIQMTNAGDANRKPMLVAAYDFLNPATIKDVNIYVPQNDIMEAHNYYPGSKLQIGLEFPKSNVTELRAVGTGKYDNWLRGMARTYKSLRQDIFLRVGYEFDGKWNAYDPTAYVSAYRRLVDIFRAECVTNVAYVWNSYTPDADSPDPTKVGYRYNGNLMSSWYPGDSYVDWFSFNEWRKGFDPAWYMSQAATHAKPVMVGESGFTKHLDSGYTFDQWVGPYFGSVRTSGVKGYQFINWNWPIYPITDWASWSDGKYTKTPLYVSRYNQEMTNGQYIVRDSSYYNPMALWAGAARAATSSVNGAAWSALHDESSARQGYGYAPLSARSYYDDGWGTYWGNAALHS